MTSWGGVEKGGLASRLLLVDASWGFNRVCALNARSFIFLSASWRGVSPLLESSLSFSFSGVKNPLKRSVCELSSLMLSK